MKVKLLIPVLVILFFTSLQLSAQDADNSKQVAGKIANRLSDSLHLKASVRKQVYDINMLISQQKMQVWKTVTDSTDLQTNLQLIEIQGIRYIKAYCRRRNTC